MSKQPMQPVEFVGKVLRFRKNALVTHLLDHGGLTMNDLAVLPNISRADREQFAQLIGYSVSGFGDLPYVRKKTLRKADRRAEAVQSALVEPDVTTPDAEQ